MPHAAIHRRRDVPPRDRGALVAAVNRAMITALRVPEDSHPVRLSEYDADAFLIPKGCGDGFTLVDITIYPGRTPETKRALYRFVIAELEALGIAPMDVRIVLYEVPREHWGLRGGIPASEIELGFTVEV